MTNPVIKVENLSKSYLIGHQSQERYTALRDVLSNAAKGFVKNAADLIRGKQLMGNDTIEEFYALKDINFEINQGDRVGIIGRNGAGKSTLLKILSRITEPTTGKITLNGRVASLLEVGTGFHPELTGRENIYLNGAILGMSRNDIKRKFDEIVAFAEVEKFLDTPVKRYSSGMYVRLAFAVAAHLEPEILIVDEVLAVGDAEFQKKCLGKMEDVSKNEGRTVLFVSHNMATIRKLCNNGIFIKSGQVSFNGLINDAVNFYSNESQNLSIESKGFYDLINHPNKKNKFGILDATILCNGVKTSEVFPGSKIELEIHIKKENRFINPEFGFVIKNSDLEPLVGLNNRHLGVNFKNIQENEIVVVFKMPNFKIYGEGMYIVNLYFGDDDIQYETFYDAFSFKIVNYDVYGSGFILDKFWNKLVDDSLEVKIKTI